MSQKRSLCSHRFYRVLQRLKSPMRNICEIFGAPQFSSFSTQSAKSRPDADVGRFLRNIIVFRQSLWRASAAGKLLFIDPFPQCRPKSKQLAELRLAAAKGGLHEHQFQVRIDKSVLSAQASKREPLGVCRIPNLISVFHQKRCRNRIGGRRCQPVLNRGYRTT